MIKHAERIGSACYTQVNSEQSKCYDSTLDRCIDTDRIAYDIVCARYITCLFRWDDRIGTVCMLYLISEQLKCSYSYRNIDMCSFKISTLSL